MACHQYLCSRGEMDITLVFETNVARSSRAESTYGGVGVTGTCRACTACDASATLATSTCTEARMWRAKVS